MFRESFLIIIVSAVLYNSFQGYLYTFSKNDVISSVWKHYSSLGLVLGLEVGLVLGL